MKRGFIKEYWFIMLVTLAMVALAVMTLQLAIGLIALGMLLYVWRVYATYNPDEMDAYNWWNRIGTTKRIEIYKKN